MLEDDMVVLRVPSPSLISQAPASWGILQLYMLGMDADALYTSPSAAWVPWQPGIFNTGAYLINRRGMREVSGRLLTWCSEVHTCILGQLHSPRAAELCRPRQLARYMCMQVLQTYLPEVLQAGTLLAAAELDASTVHGSDCVSDWLIYHSTASFTSTDFW